MGRHTLVDDAGPRQAEAVGQQPRIGTESRPALCVDHPALGVEHSVVDRGVRQHGSEAVEEVDDCSRLTDGEERSGWLIYSQVFRHDVSPVS